MQRARGIDLEEVPICLPRRIQFVGGRIKDPARLSPWTTTPLPCPLSPFLNSHHPWHSGSSQSSSMQPSFCHAHLIPPVFTCCKQCSTAVVSYVYLDLNWNPSSALPAEYLLPPPLPRAKKKVSVLKLEHFKQFHFQRESSWIYVCITQTSLGCFSWSQKQPQSNREAPTLARQSVLADFKVTF